ncbi:MAG TPA: hypothetical protein VIP52_03000 [Candidatus Dormibacteraeota bacterium]
MVGAPMPGSLPGQLTSFVGRTAELAEAAELFAACRLLTITGGGGSGKTRFAVQLAASSAAAFPDGSWFCDLAAVADPAGVADSAARALRLVQLGRPADEARQLAGKVARHRCLGHPPRLLRGTQNDGPISSRREGRPSDGARLTAKQIR